MIKNIILLLLCVTIMSAESYAQNPAPSKKPSNKNFNIGKAFGSSLLFAVVGAGAGFVVYTVANEDSERPSNDGEAQKNRNEALAWVIGGAVVGGVMGFIAGGNSNNRSNIFNISKDQKISINFPVIGYNYYTKSVVISLVRYNL